MKLNYTLLFLLLVMFSGISQAQQSHRIEIEWESPAGLVMGNDTSVLAPSFRGAQYPGLPENILPSIIRNFSLPDGAGALSASISEVVFADLTDIEKQLTSTITFPVSPDPKVELMFERRKPR
ncbi:MAG: hypothetical protein HGA37_12230, partial [Lentimicrobium sp.]|nr:hypothetical protein [Lentimicrobium sp.]